MRLLSGALLSYLCLCEYVVDVPVSVGERRRLRRGRRRPLRAIAVVHRSLERLTARIVSKRWQTTLAYKVTDSEEAVGHSGQWYTTVREFDDAFSIESSTIENTAVRYTYSGLQWGLVTNDGQCDSKRY